MLKSLSMINFQSHKDSQLEFSEGVNVIVGPSDSGKTAVLRALGWVVNNRPSGEVFRHHGSNRTKVMITTDNCEVTRMRSDKENLYRLSGNRLEAFGQEVPGVIKDALGFGMLNIQGQMDAPFLLSNSPGEVAQTLNKCVNLDIIDISLANIIQRCKRVGESIKVEEARGKELEEKLQEFEGLEEVEKLVEEIEEDALLVESIIEVIRNLALLLKEMEGLKELEARITIFLQADEMVFTALTRAEFWNDLERKALFLLQAIRMIEGLETNLSGIESLLKGEKEVLTGIQSADNLAQIDFEKIVLAGLLEQCKVLERDTQARSNSIEEDKKIYRLKMPDVCPLCGGEKKIGALESSFKRRA